MAHSDWSFTQASASRLVAYVTGREDTAVTVHPVAEGPTPGGASAWVNRLTGRVEVVASGLGYPDGATPGRVDLMRPADRGRHAILAGALLHEAGHLSHTRWVDGAAGADPAAMNAARTLEEARQEGRHLRRRPVDRMPMRAAAAHVVLSGLDDSTDGRSAAATILSLVLPRVDTGVLDDADTGTLRDIAAAEVGAEGMDVFAGIWQRALDCADDDAAGMLACGSDWVEAMRTYLPQPDQQGDQQGDQGQQCQQGGAGEDSDGEPSQGGSDAGDQPSTNTSDETDTGDGQQDDTSGGDTSGGDDPTPGRCPSGCGDTDLDSTAEPNPAADAGSGDSDAGRALRETLSRIRDAAADKAAQEAQPTTQDAADSDSTDRAAHAQAAQDVFGGIGTAGQQATIDTVPPTADAIRARAAMVTSLRKAQWRGANRTRIPSATPGGRTSMTGLMGRQAQITVGQTPTITPWRRTRTRSVDRPPLHCGIVVDVSGSLRQWFTAAGVAVWALTHAVAHLGGSAASAAFSGQVTPILAPGRPPAGVPVLHGGGGSAGCGRALAAVDGALHLTGITGARLAVVLTDSQLPDFNDIQRSVDYLASRGVVVVWATTVDNPAKVPARATVTTGVTPASFGPMLADAATKALAAADAHK